MNKFLIDTNVSINDLDKSSNKFQDHCSIHIYFLFSTLFNPAFAF